MLTRGLTFFFVACCGLVVTGCYLTSSPPRVEVPQTPERDKLLSQQMNALLAEASQVVRDMNRLVSYTLSAVRPDEVNGNVITECTEYISMFDPVEDKILRWKDENSGRFSREIWNESVFLIRHLNPQFRLRAEGRLSKDDSEKDYLSALVLAADSKDEVSAKSSDVIFVGRRRCQASGCGTVVRIDHNAIAKILPCDLQKNGLSPARGAIRADISETETSVHFEDLSFAIPDLKIQFTTVEYTRSRGSNLSAIKAKGNIKLKQDKPKEFTIEGNLRDLTSIKIL